MITQKNVQFAELIASNAGYANRRLVPRAGTPLSALVASIVGIGETGSWDEICSLSDSLNTVNGTHTAIEEDVARGAANILSIIINVARNEVNPKIKEVLAAIEEMRTREAEKKATALPIIRQVELSPIFTDEMFVEMVSNYKNSSVTFNRAILDETFKQMDTVLAEADYVEMMKTGSNGMDKKLVEYLGEDQAVIRSTVQKLFWSFADSIERQTLVDLTAWFIFLTNVHNGKLEKLHVFTDDSVQNAELISLRAHIGRRIAALVDRISKAVNSGNLIMPIGIEYYDPRYEIRVIGKTYREWIEKNGGSPEAVIGFGLWVREGNALNDVSAEGLRLDPTQYVKRYTTELRHLDTLRANAEVANVPNVVLEYLAGSIFRSEMDGTVKSALQAKLTEAMKTPFYGDSNVQDYVRDIVSATFVEGDDVKRVLIDIDLTLRENAGCDLDYAVYVAVAKLIGRWVASQAECVQTTSVSNTPVITGA